MGRAPCCEKMGLKRGPWTAEEDQKLISHIQRYGHGNWRALPKQAGLLRCGKSCRLRWINYLRPDVKRGNLTAEEEETIIKLHETLGNKWSAIAARLPGRTDNEIKNVWHTHLKKRVNPTNPPAQETKRCYKPEAAAAAPLQWHSANVEVVSQTPGSSPAPLSATSQSSGDLSCSGTDSSSVTRGNDGVVKVEEDLGDEGFSSVEFLELDDSFWKDVFSVEEDYKMPAMGGGGGGGWFLMDESQYDQHEMDFLLTAMPDAGDWPAL